MIRMSCKNWKWNLHNYCYIILWICIKPRLCKHYCTAVYRVYYIYTFFFNLRITALQCSVGFCHTLKISHDYIFMFPLPPTKNLYDNHDDVITHLEPYILECKVKWALEASWANLVEVMEFQLSYFKSWKMMLWKCYAQYASKFGKLSSGHRTGKCQFSFQSQRKALPKNAQTTAQLHSSHMLVK